MITNGVIRLRAIEPEDLEMLYQLENSHDLWDVGNTNVPYSKYALTDYITNVSYDIYQDKQVRLIIEECGTTAIAGIIDLINFDPKHRRAELGIVIMKAQRRKGYACGALQLISKYAAETLHLHQIYAITDVDNVASVELFKKAGYIYGTMFRDWLYDGHKYHNAIVFQSFL